MKAKFRIRNGSAFELYGILKKLDDPLPTKLFPSDGIIKNCNAMTSENLPEYLQLPDQLASTRL